MEIYVLIAIIIGLVIFFPIYYRHKITKKLFIIEEQKKRMDFLVMLFDNKSTWSSVFDAAKKLTNLETYHNILVIYFEDRLKLWLSFSVGTFFADTKTDMDCLRSAFAQAVANTSPQRISVIVLSSLSDSNSGEVGFLKEYGAESLLKIIAKQPNDYKKEFKQEIMEKLVAGSNEKFFQNLKQKIIEI